MPEPLFSITIFQQEQGSIIFSQEQCGIRKHFWLKSSA